MQLVEMSSSKLASTDFAESAQLIEKSLILSSCKGPFKARLERFTRDSRRLNKRRTITFVSWIRTLHVRQAPRTCGQGSAAASIVSFCLGITHVNPIRHNLMFERFLNPGRHDPPDIDIDAEQPQQEVGVALPWESAYIP